MASRIAALLIFFFSGVVLCMAQPPHGRNFKIEAEGSVVDSKTAEPLFAATVKVTSIDGGTGTFGITDSIGKFHITVERPGKYTLEFSYVGYKALTKEVSIWPGRGAKLGNFKMEEDATYLKDVETVARNQRVKQKGDTIVYNADAYKVQDGATAEDLVSKMPGIEVTDEGVKAQGETVEKVLVDGKAFFENDPKLALKTLPAEVVQSVSVFDKKSDQAEFTGFDDGNTVKAMDLTTKSYRRNGAFGKVYGSLGDNFDLNNLYWNVGFNLNLFSGNRRVSLLGMSNNVNQQNFTFDDLMSTGGMGGGPGGRMGMRMGSQAGVSRANAFGLNFNDSYLDDKLEVQGSYFYNGTRTVYENESQTDNYPYYDSIAQANIYQSQIRNTNKLSHNESHRFDMRISYKPTDRDQFLFRPSFNLQKSDENSLASTNIWSLPLDSILAMNDVARADRSQMYNFSRTLSNSDNLSWNAGGMLTWRHRFDKSGRTLSSEVRGSISGNESDGSSVRLGSSVGQGENFRNTNSEQNNWSASGNLQYTEPLGQKSQLSVRYNVNYSKSDRDYTIGFDRSMGDTEIDYYYSTYHANMDSLDARNSSRYISRNLRQGGEVAYRLHSETINLMAGLNLEASRLEGEQQYFAWDEKLGKRPDFNTVRNYFNVLPNLRFEWSPVAGTSVNIDYRVRSSNPSIQKLQQTINTSDPLNYSTGNKDLDQGTSHNIHVRFIHSNMETATNLMLFASYGFQLDNVGTQYVSNYSDKTLPLSQIAWVRALSAADREPYEKLSLVKGASISRPVNMDGTRNAMLGISYGCPWDLIWSNVNFGLNTSYAETPSRQTAYAYDTQNDRFYVMKDFTSKVRNLSVSPRLHISSNISQDLDFSLSYSPSYRKVSDKVNEYNNNEYFDQTANARLNWTFWNNFTMEQDLRYSYYGGSSMPSVVDEWVWNLSLGKKFLAKNAAEVKLQVYDLLNSRSGYSRNVGERGITQSYTNFMPRYFMLTFTYKISNYKGSSAIKERKRGGMGPGGPGPGGPMMF